MLFVKTYGATGFDGIGEQQYSLAGGATRRQEAMLRLRRNTFKHDSEYPFYLRVGRWTCFKLNQDFLPRVQLCLQIQTAGRKRCFENFCMTDQTIVVGLDVEEVIIVFVFKAALDKEIRCPFNIRFADFPKIELVIIPRFSCFRTFEFEIDHGGL